MPCLEQLERMREEAQADWLGTVLVSHGGFVSDGTISHLALKVQLLGFIISGF